jgi:electron transport complex protein RnfG
MKELIKITASLTGICVAAALILGAVFAKTEDVRKANQEKIKEETIQGLLGFGHGKKAPEDLKIFPVQRYVITDPKATVLGYLVPLKDKSYSLVTVDLTGKPLKAIPVKADAAKIADAGSRDAVVKESLPKDAKATYADTVYIANLGDKRLGYVIPGVTQGFKTFVNLMVSLNPDFTVTGIEITKSEEDPGLGDEIKKDFFKNQFKGKTLDVLKDLKVVKEPLPADYFVGLDPMRSKATPEQVAQVREKHLKDDIYALTGATISSRAVTNGVKETVRKFVYRFGILADVMKQENVQAAF